MQTQPSEKEADHSRAVREMFSGIARRYDLLNHVLSLNIDKRWRRLVVRELSDTLARRDAVVLDVACGTGDLSLALADGAAARVIGTDFCRPMLEIARSKSEKAEIPYVEGDAMVLPFENEAFDAVTIAFGLRNLANTADGLTELERILKPGGRLAILEFSTPIVPGFGQLFNFYFARILPRIGGLISGSRSAYEYLPDSVARFPNQKRLAARIENAGFHNVSYSNLTGGIAALHLGTKSM